MSQRRCRGERRRKKLAPSSTAKLSGQQRQSRAHPARIRTRPPRRRKYLFRVSDKGGLLSGPSMPPPPFLKTRRSALPQRRRGAGLSKALLQPVKKIVTQKGRAGKPKRACPSRVAAPGKGGFHNSRFLKYPSLSITISYPSDIDIPYQTLHALPAYSGQPVF